MQEYSEELIVKEMSLQQLQSEYIHLLWKEESEHHSLDRDADDGWLHILGRCAQGEMCSNVPQVFHPSTQLRVVERTLFVCT